MIILNYIGAGTIFDFIFKILRVNTARSYIFIVIRQDEYYIAL